MSLAVDEKMVGQKVRHNSSSDTSFCIEMQLLKCGLQKKKKVGLEVLGLGECKLKVFGGRVAFVLCFYE